jgi:catechol 2,3-dioxygenase-like lactoylglutathione lyase family enzyme
MAITYDGGLTCSFGVTDLGRSIDWYRDILGFELLYRRDDIAWCELSTGVEKVNVGLSQRQEAGGSGGSTLTFGVENLEAAKASLDGNGVRQDGDIIEIDGLVRLLTFYDPDGNALMFYQVPAEGSGQ